MFSALWIFIFPVEVKWKMDDGCDLLQLKKLFRYDHLNLKQKLKLPQKNLKIQNTLVQ